jgi:hypothetical protein
VATAEYYDTCPHRHAHNNACPLGKIARPIDARDRSVHGWDRRGGVQRAGQSALLVTPQAEDRSSARPFTLEGRSYAATNYYVPTSIGPGATALSKSTAFSVDPEVSMVHFYFDNPRGARSSSATTRTHPAERGTASAPVRVLPLAQWPPRELRGSRASRGPGLDRGEFS